MAADAWERSKTTTNEKNNMKNDDTNSCPVILINITDHETTLRQFGNSRQLAAMRPGLATIEAECDVMEARAESDNEASRPLVIEINAKRKLCGIFRDVIPVAEAMNEAKAAGERARIEVARLNAEMETLSAEVSELEARDIRGWNGEVPCIDPIEMELDQIKQILEWGSWGTDKELRATLTSASWYGGIPSKKGALARIEYLREQIPLVKAEEAALLERIKNRLSDIEISRLNSMRSRIAQIDEELANANTHMGKLDEVESAASSKFQAYLESARIRAGGIVEALQIRTKALHLESA